MNRRKRAFGVEGYTLIELIISITILAAITGTITAVFITTFNGNANATQRIHESNDAQLIASFWVKDAQAAGGSNPITGTIDSSLGVSTSDAASCSLGGGNLVTRFKWNDRAAAVTTSRVADYVYQAGTSALERRTCTNGAADAIVSLATQVSAAPSIVCAPVADCSGIPDTVSITVTERNDHGTSPYTFTLKASLRPQSQVPPSASNAAGSPLLVLSGSCSSGYGLSVSGNTTVIVNGQAVINATDSGGCSAMTANGSITYSSDGTSLTTGGTCTGNSCPATTIDSTPIGNPFASLPAPGSCSGGSGNPASGQPGTYHNAAAITGALASGVYIFCSTVSFSGTITGTGVMLYFAGASSAFSLAGGVNIDLKAPTTGNYAGILIWNATTNPVSINGNGSLANYNGVLYSPNAIVTVAGTSTTYIGMIVAKGIVFSGNHTTDITNGSVTPGAPSSFTATTSTTTLRRVDLSWLAPGYTGAIGNPITGYEYRVDSGSGYGAWTAVPGGLVTSYAHTCGTSDTVATTCTYQVRALNAQGTGTASAPASAQSFADNTAPAPTVTGPASGATTGTTTIFSGTAGTATGDGTLMTVRVYSGATCSGAAQTVTTNRVGAAWTVASPVMTGGAKAVCVTQSDLAGNIGTSAPRTFSVDATAPTVTAVVLANASGQVAKGDSVAITFSEAINPASLCLGWNGTSRNTIVVTITNNDPATANNDSLTVTDPGCTFNFGKINLGTPNWVTATTSYSGGGGNASTAAFSLANTKLTIVLGNGTAGALAIPAQTVIYTPSPLITDAVGNAIGGAYSFVTQRF